MNPNLMRIALVVAVLVAALLLLLGLFLFVRFLVRRRRRLAETGALKKDLMVWRNIRSLVQGGDKARQAKADLSSRIGQLRALFRLGLRQLHEEHGGNVVPWILVLGEPDAGKSSLLAKAGLDMHACVRSDAVEKHSILPWVGPDGYCLDVGGRVFFDRWLEGSGAEWDETISLVRRNHARCPLDGIVLCVPADALVADESSLTREKTALVSAELRRLVSRVGANVPCHVVVTKCDMLLGWREYFARLSEAERFRPFGWRNERPAESFDPETFAGWWKGAVGGLKDGLVSRLAEDVGLDGGLSRFATAGRAYLLPDSFDAIRANLMTYLGRVFGADAWHGRDQLLLTGVFFTSACDTGTVLSAEYAKFVGKRPEEAPLQADSVEMHDGLFIRGFLREFVFGRKLVATYTARALFRRQLFGYLAAAVLVWGAFVLITTALGPRGKLAARLVPATQFYREVARHLQNGDLVASPLVALDDKGELKLLESEALNGAPDVTRLRYLHRAKSVANDRLFAGYGWYAASFLRFGFNPDLGAHVRRGIFNRVQAEMVFLPLVRCFETHELARTDNVFNEARRQAFGTYNDISQTLSPNSGRVVDASALVAYLMRDVGPDIAQLLSSCYPGCGGGYRDFCAMVAYDLDFVKVERKLISSFFESWSDLSIYPEAAYPVMRCILTNSLAYVETDVQARALAEKLGPDVTANEPTLATLREMLAVQRVRAEAVKLHVDELSEFFGESEGASEKGLSVDPMAHALSLAVGDYRRRLNEDRRQFTEDVIETSGLLSDRVASAYFKTLSPEILKTRFDAIDEKIVAEANCLQNVAAELRKSGLTRQIKPKTGAKKLEEIAKSDAPYVFDVKRDLQAAARLAVSDETLTDAMQIGAALMREAEREASAKEALAEVAGRAAGDPSVAPFLSTARRFVDAQTAENRVRLLREYVRLHPQTEGDVGRLVANLGEGPSENAERQASLRESLGTLTFKENFDETGLRQVLAAYAEVRRLMKPAKSEKEDAAAEGATAAPPLSVEGYRGMEAAMDDYLNAYIKYCRDLPEGLPADIGEDWASFRAACIAIKPYAVNAALLSLYAQMRDGLKAIPPETLSADQVKRRGETISLISRRMELLGASFTETCTRQVGAWAVLPASAAEAAKCLREMPAKVLLSDYLAVFGTEDKSNVPWWTSFFLRGLRLMHDDAMKLGFAQLKQENGRFLRVPLCRDPFDPSPLTDKELGDANDALLACGCAIPGRKGTDDEKPVTAGKQVSPDDESGNMVLGYVRGTVAMPDDRGNRLDSPVDLTRGAEMLALVETLTLRKNVTVWTLSVPPLAKRLDLQKKYLPGLPLSTFRYRYGEVTVAGDRRGAGAALDDVTEIVLARGDLGDCDLCLKFREFSDSPVVGAEARFDGPWAALRLYFTPGSVIEGKKGKQSVYLPLIVRDAYGLGSVCWLTMTFNGALPTPAEWPSTERWVVPAGVRPLDVSGRKVSPTAAKEP